MLAHETHEAVATLLLRTTGTVGATRIERG